MNNSRWQRGGNDPGALGAAVAECENGRCQPTAITPDLYLDLLPRRNSSNISRPRENQVSIDDSSQWFKTDKIHPPSTIRIYQDVVHLSSSVPRNLVNTVLVPQPLIDCAENSVVWNPRNRMYMRFEEAWSAG